MSAAASMNRWTIASNSDAVRAEDPPANGVASNTREIFSLKSAIVPILCLGAVLIQAILAIASYASFQQSARMEVEWLHDLRILARVQALLSNIESAETREQGYLLTGNALYADGYRQAKATIEQTFADLRALAAPDPVQAGRVVELERLTAERTASLAQDIARRHLGAAVLQQEELAHRAALMAEIRNVAAALEEGERTRLATSREEWSNAERRVTGTVLIGTVFSGTIIVWLAIAIGFERSRRRAALEHLADDYKLLQLFLGVVGHELRNPVSFIRIAAGFLKTEASLDGELAEAVNRIDQSAARAIKLAQELVDATRARLGSGIVIRPKRVDLGALAASVVQQFSASYPRRQITIEGGEGCLANADPDRMLQALTNLVENALRYGRPDAPIVVSARSASDGVRIQVANQGQPIAPELIPRLFDPFSRGASDKYQEGLGLGLYIADQIVRAHGGRIEVDSDRSNGTLFTIILPSSV